tara:strand:- start:335873 stop:336610 length:738 start_codon:yes stop_codon:yes gene_type:complete
MKRTHIHCLTIAGHDPSDGAGLSSDVQTFQCIGVPSLSVCTSITFQNDDEFESVDWLPIESIQHQLKMLLGTYTIGAIKIGLIENLSVLKTVLTTIDHHYGTSKKPVIVWDPILSASAGFQFHKEVNTIDLQSVLQNVDLVTPNIPESEVLFPNATWEKGEDLPCSVLLKGGHGSGEESKDVLFHADQMILYSAKRIAVKKHGTGCILSAAICAYLAQGKAMHFAAQYAKDYLHKELLALASIKP